MPAGTIAALSALWLAVGFALVLWGFRIFKAWVVAIGAIGGGAAGAAITGAISGGPEGALMGGLLGAAGGALIAWPLQRVMVFFAAGVTTGTVAAAAAVAFAGSDYVAGAAIAGFLLGGILAAWLYETVVIAAMAFTGAQAVFHALYVPIQTFTGSPETIAGRILGIYAEEFVVFVATVAIFVAFAIWYQRGPAKRRDRSPAEAARAIAARRVSVRLAFAIVAAWFAAAILVAAGFWPVSTFELVGMHPLSWPPVAIAGLVFLSLRPIVTTQGPGDAPPVGRYRSRSRLLRAAAFAAVAPPVLTAALFVSLGGSWDGLIDYYRAFLAGPAAVVATKWTFSLGLLPLLLFSAHPIVVVPVQPPEVADAAADEDVEGHAEPEAAGPAEAGAPEDIEDDRGSGESETDPSASDGPAISA